MGIWSDAERSRQLGMHFGTATNRLKRMLMFQLMCQAGRNICYRCGGMISDERDWHVDHKIAWLHSEDAIDLFFDLDNIAFSHVKCNVDARRNPSACGSPSGFRGVSFVEDRPDPWRATISIDGSMTHLGYFPTREEAALAYDRAAVERWGDRAVTNYSLSLGGGCL